MACAGVCRAAAGGLGARASGPTLSSSVASVLSPTALIFLLCVLESSGPFSHHRLLCVETGERGGAEG